MVPMMYVQIKIVTIVKIIIVSKFCNT